MGVWNNGVWNAPITSAPGVGSITFQQLLRSSFRCIGQLLPGFGYAPEELIDGLFILNAMLDSWAADDLNAPWTLIQIFALIAGKVSYSVGPGGDWNGPRPTRLTQATLIVLDNPTQPLYEDLAIINADQYGLIALPGTQSTLPRKIFYNPTNPLGTATLWPVPAVANNVQLSSTQPIAGVLGFIVTDTALFIAPPGYLDAVRYNLAVRLAMEWGKPLKEGVAALAVESMAVIQRLNAPTPQMQLNPGASWHGGRGGFNRLTGDFE